LNARLAESADDLDSHVYLPFAVLASIAAWAGLPVAIAIAMVGAVAGAIAGAVGGGSLGIVQAIHVSTSSSILGALLGAVAGLAAGFVFIFVDFVHNPIDLVTAIIAGFVFGALALGVISLFEPVSMRLRGYRTLSRRERARLDPLLIETGRRMGLLVVPELWASDSMKPAAWTYPRAIVLSKGLIGHTTDSEEAPRSELDDGALSAVLAHELHHWVTGDPTGTRFVWAILWPLALIYNLVDWLKRSTNPFISAFVLVLSAPVWLTVRLVTAALAMLSRSKEYDADEACARLGDDYRLGLRRALHHVADWEVPRTGWERALEATHPPIEYRLEHLELDWPARYAAKLAAEGIQTTSPASWAGISPASTVAVSHQAPAAPASRPRVSAADASPTRPARSRSQPAQRIPEAPPEPRPLATRRTSSEAPSSPRPPAPPDDSDSQWLGGDGSPRPQE
jgi:Zn-dependent protease with chaperone function